MAWTGVGPMAGLVRAVTGLRWRYLAGSHQRLSVQLNGKKIMCNILSFSIPFGIRGYHSQRGVCCGDALQLLGFKEVCCGSGDVAMLRASLVEPTVIA